MRGAVRDKIRADKRKLRELERHKGMKGYSEGHGDVFESIAAEPFEER